MAARKRQQTMAKFQREQAVREKRARKLQKKQDAALLKAEGGVVDPFAPEAGDAEDGEGDPLEPQAEAADPLAPDTGDAPPQES